VRFKRPPKVTEPSWCDTPRSRSSTSAPKPAPFTDAYRNLVLCQVNQHCLRLAVIEGQYPWHSHPASDELFLVLEGTLVIDLADHRELRLRPGQAVVVPAGIVHRTRGKGRTVNLCVEDLAAATQFVPDPRTRG
jgi:mannose-6-phosphate isomerase-like protein (cupin superfamily)